MIQISLGSCKRETTSKIYISKTYVGHIEAFI